MAHKKRTPEQIVRCSQQADEMAATGLNNAQVAAKLEVSPSPALYNWRKRYRGMDTEAAKQLQALQDENAKLKRMVAKISC
ncbi:MAG TPA: transposase [Candidatus Corynebacterium gallistercoris]|uniref:Transposase n=1 Tax=Candidatus Corynebacterium gallistercoris TaxID=2838530 RepID=A0A9D1UPJ7_9CORY|nr:transposase [Candidatus Corynebacterium gallistercoris]